MFRRMHERQFWRSTGVTGALMATGWGSMGWSSPNNHHHHHHHRSSLSRNWKLSGALKATGWCLMGCISPNVNNHHRHHHQLWWLQTEAQWVTLHMFIASKNTFLDFNLIIVITVEVYIHHHHNVDQVQQSDERSKDWRVQGSSRPGQTLVNSYHLIINFGQVMEC